MDLADHYNSIYSDFINKSKTSNFKVDEYIYSKDDDRYGITLLLRPPAQIKNNIQVFLNDLKAIEPDQYYYRNNDIHITVLSIISCYRGFRIESINLDDYNKIIIKALRSIKSFDIHFKGVTATLSGVMIQGFLNDTTLNDIRDKLRLLFNTSGLQESIDRRYSLKTAHSTVARFRKEVERKSEFIEVIENYRDYDFGSFKVDSLELVSNDWYQRYENVKTHFTYKLY